MEIKVGDRAFALDCGPGRRVKIYAVPERYSEDGIFAACFGPGDMEPAPACLGSEARLLADVAVEAAADGSILISGPMAEGVEIHAQN